MIDITSFLLKHLYELMADNYNVATQHRLRPTPQYPELVFADEPAPQQQLQQQQQQQTDAKQGLENQVIEPLGREPAGDSTPSTHQQVISSTSNQQAITHQTMTNARDHPDIHHQTTSSSLISSALCRFNYCRRASSSGVVGSSASPSRADGSSSTDESSAQAAAAQAVSRNRLAREQETNQQIVAFLINNQLPDLACETLIELIFICVFLAVSWIFVMIIQLHCHQTSSTSSPFLQVSSSSSAEGSTAQTFLQHQTTTASPHESYQYARDFYCNTKFLNSLMYCNNKNSKAFSS